MLLTFMESWDKENANLILEKNKVKTIAKKILLRYFKTLENKSAKELLDDTDCIIEIIPDKIFSLELLN